MRRNEKGVTLTVLAITIIIMIIITGTIIYTWKDSISIKKVNNLYSDIESISTKITTFYLENEELPVYSTKYATSVNDFSAILDANEAGDDTINPNDGDDYYVIDLSKLDNLTLNYGQEYLDWKEQATPSPTDYQDLYVINSLTQQIYYPQGVKYKNKSYFTTDTGITSVDRIDKFAFEEGFGIEDLSTIFQKNKQANEKVIATSDIEISIDTTNYVVSTLSYVFIEDEQDENERKNLEYTKFTLNSENKSSIVSKGLDRLTQEYYLYLRVLDINGQYHYLEQPIDRLENAEVGWALADDQNENNDWYQYLDTSGTNTVAQVNAPRLADGMEAVKYVGEEGMDDTTVETLNSGSRWANAVTKDGSMWVWIPRYVYRISSGYHKNGADINPDTPELGAGTIEIAFVDIQNRFLDKSLRGQTIITGEVTDETYSTGTSVWILEPAFDLGDDHLPGFWAAKFEASNTNGYGGASATANSTGLTLQVKPNATSWRSITSLNMFTVCQELKSNTNYKKYFDNITNVDTHMMKNVEWGACAYLAHSKYGLNGEKIYINNYNGYKTGISGLTSTEGSSSSDENKYNTTIGINASTSKNIYGIYDMSGCADEYVAGCYTGATNKLTANTDMDYVSKYIDVYGGYSISKYGDAIYETSRGAVSAQNAWFKGFSNIITSSYPVLRRRWGL